MFNKRHYEAIALVMQDLCPPKKSDDVVQWATTVTGLAELFAQDNRLFKRERFIEACKPGRNVRAHNEKYTNSPSG